MKNWGLIVLFLYGLILVALTIPVGMISFAPKLGFNEMLEALEVYTLAPYWIWIGIMLVCQAALLLVPVRMSLDRPVSRLNIFWPILATGLMIGVFALGLIFAIDEFIEKENKSEWVAWGALGLGAAVWIVWTVIFFRWSSKQAPRNIILQQCKYLFRGSILELLIAVPTHIVARSRDYCCAGFLTFVGIAMGIAVMLLSFGPGIVFMYADRWKKLHPNHPAGQDNSGENRPN